MASGLYRDSTSEPSQDSSDDDESLPTVDGVTDTAKTTAGLPTKLAELLSQRPGGSTAHTARVVMAIEDALKGESNDTLRGRYAAARSIILGT